MTDITPYIEKAEKYHGHICSGQILGIRMTLLGLSKLGLKPTDNLRDVMIFLESNRCVADAAYVVTGITVGRRRIIMKDYGKTAMSFLDLNSRRAVRISVQPVYPPKGISHEELLAFWARYEDDEIFRCQKVQIAINDGDLPGPPVRVVTCCQCGDEVMDCREIVRDGKTYCRACAQGAYYTLLED